MAWTSADIYRTVSRLYYFYEPPSQLFILPPGSFTHGSGYIIPYG
jgi:hypothetical protein